MVQHQTALAFRYWLVWSSANLFHMYNFHLKALLSMVNSLAPRRYGINFRNVIFEHMLQIMLSLWALVKLHCWSLGMDKWFHPTLYNGCNYLSIQGLYLIHVGKRAQGLWAIIPCTTGVLLIAVVHWHIVLICPRMQSESFIHTLAYHKILWAYDF